MKRHVYHHVSSSRVQKYRVWRFNYVPYIHKACNTNSTKNIPICCSSAPKWNGVNRNIFHDRAMTAFYIMKRDLLFFLCLFNMMETIIISPTSVQSRNPLRMASTCWSNKYRTMWCRLAQDYFTICVEYHKNGTHFVPKEFQRMSMFLQWRLSRRETVNGLKNCKEWNKLSGFEWGWNKSPFL